MFALQVNFIDATNPEVIFVRRQQALIGGDESAHVVIDDMKGLPFQLRIVRQIGRNFLVEQIAKGDQRSPLHVDGNYHGSAELQLGSVRLGIVVLDIDLTVREGEPLDKASIRILRSAYANPSPRLPALVTRGAHPCVISLIENQPYIVGRSRASSIRLESADISAKHAKVSFEDHTFWVEDLGSTNGTFVEGKRVTGKVAVSPLTQIVFGREVGLYGILTEEALNRFDISSGTELVPQTSSFPCLVSLSSVVRPSRLPLMEGMQLRIGRESSCDVWLGAPHASRQHCLVSVRKNVVTVTDVSTNGTGYDDGLLHHDEQIKTSGRPYVLNFGAGVTVGVVFSPEQEASFRQNDGSPTTFSSSSTQKSDREGGSREQADQYESRKTIFQPLQALEQERSNFLATSAVRVYSELSQSKKVCAWVVLVAAFTLIASIAALLVSAWIR